MITNNIDELAIFGGKPSFTRKLHVGQPNIGNRQSFMERVNDILDRKWLTNNGQYVKEFEKRIADTIGVRNCIAMSNGTVALEIAIRALGFKGEVILPSFTFIATAHALQWQEITPVFCDIDPATHTIDPRKVEELITPRTTGIIGVHLWGRPCDIESLSCVAEKRKLGLMFDASHAFACTYKKKPIGCFGRAEVFSFHATKLMNTLEGGAIATDDDELAGKIRLMKNFGFTYYDCVDYIGTNGKMNEISAAMGLCNLESIETFIQINRRNYSSYKSELDKITGISLLQYDNEEKCNYQYIVAEIDEKTTHITRDAILEILHAENVLARRYFYPGCHRMEPYRSYYPHAGLLLPETERLCSKVLVLPTGTSTSETDIKTICGIISFAISHGSDISRKLTGIGRYHATR